MWKLKDDLAIISSGVEGVDFKFRLKPADKGGIAMLEGLYLVKAAVHDTLGKAINAFRTGQADYQDACERLGHLHEEYPKSSYQLVEACMTGLSTFLADPEQIDLFKGWVESQKPQTLADLTVQFIDFWEKNVKYGG
jgi:hypothetical protein